ncbi:MAG: hypothetical protein CMP75_01660 [Flavobacteriales bacterium]|nr:hypothetical protein [Flavobacteriales bacterium]|tara:strand:- start:3839 stop:6226 length:2388 start_codon:yes stop_codon:yes gene_type:complete
MIGLGQNSIKIDGFFEDWDLNTSTYIDDSFDSEGIELLEFNACHDDEYLYIKIKLDTEIDLTEDYLNPSKLMINIDADNNPSTGYFTNNIGSEYGINFFDKLIFDDTNFPLVDTLSLYDLNIIPLPTYTSNQFEIAIDRSLFSETIAISIKETISNDKMPDNGDIFNYSFDEVCYEETAQFVGFEKTDSLYLRLFNYNVLSNGLKNNNRIDEHRRIFESVGADIITYQECGNTTYNDVLNFLNTSQIYYPYIYPDLNSGNLTISKYPSLQSWQVSNKINAELIDLPDSFYDTDILILNGHPPCCGNNQGRQENFDAFIQFIIDAKTPGGIIDLETNTPISFSGDMNLVGYAEQYYTIVNGTISDTVTFGPGGMPDWDDTPLEDQRCYFNEKNIAYTWYKNNPTSGDFPPGRLDFVFFTNSVMSVDKSFIISTEHMSESLLTENNLLPDDTKVASDHFPVIVDYVFKTWNCENNSCIEISDGAGEFTSLDSCEEECFSDPTWNCSDNFACIEVNDGTGEYTSLINCEEQCEPIYGCTDILACNYDPQATAEAAAGDPEECIYIIDDLCETCVDGNILFIDEDNDGICDAYEIGGCTDILACNYNNEATDEDGSCEYVDGVCDLCDTATGTIFDNDSDDDGICDDDEIETYNCINSVCIDPGDNTGTYTSIDECEAICSMVEDTTWDCIDNSCVDIIHGEGMYDDLNECEAACVQFNSTYNCIEEICTEVNDGTGLFNSLEGCQEFCNATSITDYNNSNKKLRKIINLLGQETPIRKNSPMFYIYDDGTVEKKVIIE